MTLQNKRNRLFLKSALVTIFVIACGVMALCFMGQAYRATEKTAFGKDVSVISLTDYEHISFFGKEVYFPIFKVADFFENVKIYTTTGINKLLVLTVGGVKELLSYFIQQI